MNPARSTTAAAARRVGVLMLIVFPLYGIGSTIATTAAAAPPADGTALLLVGAVMMLLNSAAVIAIGVLMLPILRSRSPIVAVTYLATRVLEGVVLAAGVVSLLSRSSSAIAGNFLAYNIAMTGLGVGSLFFCVALFRSRLVPRFLAAWGFVGYASFAAGCVLELLGFTGAGLIPTIPGGLFEVFFAIWLLVKGFTPAQDDPAAGPAALRPAAT